MPRFEKGNTCVYNLGYHIVWIPKYRRKILTGKIKEIIGNALQEKAKEIDIKIIKYEIMPDHIHLFIKFKPILSVSKIVMHLKGYSSYVLRKEYPQYRKYKSLWTPSYYCESVGHISEETIKKYINDQWLHY